MVNNGCDIKLYRYSFINFVEFKIQPRPTPNSKKNKRLNEKYYNPTCVMTESENIFQFGSLVDIYIGG